MLVVGYIGINSGKWQRLGAGSANRAVRSPIMRAPR